MSSKKALVLVLAIVMCLSLCLTACGGSSSTGTTTTATAQTSSGDSSGTAAAAPDKVYNWKFQSTENDTIAMYRERDEICQKIAEETNGGLIITQYSGGAIISDMNIPDAVMTGTIEMGNVYLNPLYASVPTSNMVGITPGFLFDVGDCMLYLLGYGALDVFKTECEETLNCYCYPELTGRVLYCTNKEVHEAEDFKGLQIKSYGPLGNIYTKLGASVVTLSGSEIYTALQTNLIDAANWGAYEGAVGASLQEVTKYFIEPCMGIGVGTVDLINKDAYDALPADYQAIVDKYFSTRIYDSVLATDTGEYNARQTMLDAGMQPSELSEDCKATIREMALTEIETLSKANDACAEIYDDLMLFLEYQDTLQWN
ncbi:MAG: TRAP transporter substrate-binding protein DctP [Oscillospiraceae bacterium]